MENKRIPSIGYNSILNRIKTLNEKSEYDFVYHRGDIIKALFETNTTTQDFSSRMDSDKSELHEQTSNNIIKDLTRFLNKEL
jgi:hypothetical protein